MTSADKSAMDSGGRDLTPAETRPRADAGTFLAFALLVGASVGWGVSAPLVKFSLTDLPPLSAACRGSPR